MINHSIDQIDQIDFFFFVGINKNEKISHKNNSKDPKDQIDQQNSRELNIDQTFP